MEAKYGINRVTKYCGMYTLLTVVMVMATMVSSLSRQANQNNSAQYLANISARPMSVTHITTQLAEEKWNKSAVVGMTVELACPQYNGCNLVTWNVDLDNGTYCHLSYKMAKDEASKNCSKNVDWLSRPDQRPSLQIKSPQIFNEGKYKCSVACSHGSFNYEYSLTVLVPPVVSMTQNINGSLTCKAVAGKPAAQISWSPAGDYATVAEVLLDGTETITSTYNIINSSADNVTCIVSHPAWNESRVLKLGRRNTTVIILYTSLICLLGIFILLLFIYLWRLFYKRKRDLNALKSPETISTTLSFQENETEPYATFVQVENVIYDKTSDCLPGFSSSM